MASADAPTGRDRPIVLVGFMAVGKSTIGRELADTLGLAFVDSDKEIEHAFGLSVSEIFARHGEPAFRQAERETIARLLAGGPSILSVGGGAFNDASTRAALTQGATVVWLDPPFDLIMERVRRSKRRPLAQGTPTEELRALWAERSRAYREAHVRIVTSDAAHEVAVTAIVEALAALG